MEYYLYIVRCADGTLYTGIAKDCVARVKEHNEGRYGAKYTRGRRPVTLVYSQKCKDKSEALTRELEVKNLSKNEKEAMILRGDKYRGT